jgi:hypothetical protein
VLWLKGKQSVNHEIPPLDELAYFTVEPRIGITSNLLLCFARHSVECPCSCTSGRGCEGSWGWLKHIRGYKVRIKLFGSRGLVKSQATIGRPSLARKGFDSVRCASYSSGAPKSVLFYGGQP